MNRSCIEISGLTYKSIFNNFNIAFKKDQFIILSGPNNCGKTTLIRIIDNQISLNNSVLVCGKKQEDYKITDFSNIVKAVIPEEITFIQSTVEEELSYQLSTELPKEERRKKIREIAKKLQLTKFLTKTVETLSTKEVVRLQLALAFINNPKIILIDDLKPYFNSKELIELVQIIKDFGKEEKITIIMVASNLTTALLSDYMYVISESKIVIEGTPKEVLEKDNILNKAGLNLPFMIDLSVKLIDYDLIKKIEMDMDRMVDTLWK